MEAIQKKSLNNIRYSQLYRWIASVFDLAMAEPVEYRVVAVELN